jgi:hypothetical protein
MKGKVFRVDVLAKISRDLQIESALRAAEEVSVYGMA